MFRNLPVDWVDALAHRLHKGVIMNTPAWLLISDPIVHPVGNNVRSHALAILASGGQGSDLKVVLGNAMNVLFKGIPQEVSFFSYEGGSFDRTQGCQPTRLSLNADIEPLALKDWKQVLNPKLKTPAPDWPYDLSTLAAWRVVLSIMEMLHLHALDVRLSNQLKGCRLLRD